MICPNGKEFNYKYKKPIEGNNYGRTEEIYECEDCTGCQYKTECCPRAKTNRKISLNEELTSMHKEVLKNINSIQGALLL